MLLHAAHTLYFVLVADGHQNVDVLFEVREILFDVSFVDVHVELVVVFLFGVIVELSFGQFDKGGPKNWFNFINKFIEVSDTLLFLFDVVFHFHFASLFLIHLLQHLMFLLVVQFGLFYLCFKLSVLVFKVFNISGQLVEIIVESIVLLF